MTKQESNPKIMQIMIHLNQIIVNKLFYKLKRIIFARKFKKDFLWFYQIHQIYPL